MDKIEALSQTFPAIIEHVVANSLGKDYYHEFGAAKPEKIRAMTSELLDGMMGYLKTASLEHARSEMKEFQENTQSEDSGIELKALWTDIIAEASLLNPDSKNLLHQVWGVFDRLINESHNELPQK